MTYSLLIIISKEKPQLNNIDYLWLNEDFSFLDLNHINSKSGDYEFTYLIYSNKINVNYQKVSIMLEHKIPVTNFLCQTSEEYIYFFDEDNMAMELEKIISEF